MVKDSHLLPFLGRVQESIVKCRTVDTGSLALFFKIKEHTDIICAQESLKVGRQQLAKRQESRKDEKLIKL